MEFDLSEKTLKLLRDCFALYPEIEQVNVYGSRAMGNYRRGSDIDLAFYADGDYRLAAQLFTDLDELPTPYRCDVTDYHRLAHLPLKDHIDRIGKSLYTKSTLAHLQTHKKCAPVIKRDVITGTENQAIRWKQRFGNLDKALKKLNFARQAYENEPDNELYQMALIQAFEFTFELGWKTIKDYLNYEGLSSESLPRKVIRDGVEHEVIDDGESWIQMLQDRNLMAHTYDEDNARIATEHITESYVDAVHQVYTYLKNKLDKE